MIKNSVRIIWVIFLLLSTLTATGLIGYFAYRQRKRFSNQNGFMCFLVDTEKERIKVNNSIKTIWTNPSFLRKMNFGHNKWRKIQDFLDLFDRKSKTMLDIAIKNKEIINISTEIAHNKIRFLSTKVNIIFNNIQENNIFFTMNWYKSDTREDRVFEATNTNIDYLIDKNNEYLAFCFILNIKEIKNINNFVALFKSKCIKSKMANIKVFLDWNKLFFIMPYSKISRYNAIKYNKNFSKWSLPYKHLWEKTFSFDNSLLTNKNIISYQTLFDYIKTNNNLIANGSLITSKIYENEDFLVFKEKYEYVLDEIKNSFNIDSKTKSILGFDDSKWKIDEIETDNKFEILNIKNENLLSTLDIYKNFYLKIFNEAEDFQLNGKLINIDDFIFNLIENKKIENCLLNYKSFFQTIIINSKKSLFRIRKKIETIQKENPNVGIGLKIKNLNNDLLSEIDKWVKIIWIGKELTNKLNNPEVLLYINILYKKAEQYNINIIFDKLDSKNYKKVLQNEKLKLFFTK